VAPTKLHLDSSPIINEPSSAKVIVEMPGNNDEAFCRTCSDDVSLAVKTLDEATQTVRDLLAGRSQETEIFSSTDKHIRSAVGAELLAALSRPNIEEREHARQLFLDNGYLDDAMRVLSTTGLPNERAMAARALGLIVSPRGIMSLVGALLDDAPEVRQAAEQALSEIGGPVVANLGALLEEESNFEAAEVVELFSTPTTVAFQETPIQNLTIEERMVEKPMSKASELRASTICLEEESVQKGSYLEEERVQKATQELKHQLLEAEDLTRKRNELVQKAMQELEHRLLETEELTRKSIELETAQRVEAHAARCAEAQQALRELEEMREKELALLRSEADSYQQDLEVVAQQRAGIEEVHLEAETQIRRFVEEKAELEAALNARRAAAEELRLEREAEIRRFDEEKAELDATVEGRRAAACEVRIQTQAQTRRFEEEIAELKAAVEARRAGVGEVRLQTEAQIRRFDEETADLKAAADARRAGVGQVRLQTEAQIRRFDEETAELKAAVEARRAGVGEVRLETQAQISRFDEEIAELKAAVEARRAGVEEVRLEAQEQMRRFDEEKAELAATVDTRRAAADEVRLQTQAQIRRFDEEKAELEATVDTRRAAADEVRIQTQAQILRLDEEKAELEAAIEARRAALGEVRLETRAQIRRFDEEKAELEAAVEARRAAVDEVRLQTQAQIQRLDEERAELAAAAAARQSEAERQLSEADSKSRAEQGQLLLQTANLEQLTAEVAQRRAEVEASLHKANEEDERMLEMQQATEERRLEAAAQIRRFDEEKAGLKTAVEARQVELENVRIEAKRQLSEAENRIRAGQEELLLQTADLERVTQEVTRRRAEIEVSLRKAREEDERLLKKLQATEQLRLETEAQARRFDEERAEIEDALKARQAEAERQLIEAGTQLVAAEKSSAEQAQFLSRTHVTEDVAYRSAEADAPLDKANEELRLLLEATERGSEVLWLEPEICHRTDLDKPKATAVLVDLPSEEVEKLRSLNLEQEELDEKRKSVGASVGTQNENGHAKAWP
jgi:hypothetical protein